MSETKYIQIIQEISHNFFDKLGIDYNKIEIEKEDNSIYRINLEVDNPPFIIGFHGERLKAIQILLKTIAWKNGIPSDQYIILDVDGYQKAREKKVLDLATEKYETVVQTQISQTMPPLDPYLRRKVHLLIIEKNNSKIKTESFGDGSSRRIKIFYEK